VIKNLIPKTGDETMNRAIIVLIAASVSAAPLFADLGETEAQLVARYGNPIPTPTFDGLSDKTLGFACSGWTVICGIKDGRCWMEGWDTKPPRQISEPNAANLMRQKNFEPKGWAVLSDSMRTSFRADGATCTWVNAANSKLLFGTAGYQAAMNRKSPAPNPAPSRPAAAASLQWAGAASRTCEKFFMPSAGWKVRYTARRNTTYAEIPILFFLDVTDAASGRSAEFVTLTADGSGDTMIHKAGEFYLKINSGNCAWTVSVEPAR
jgi:hypothetical protein